MKTKKRPPVKMTLQTKIICDKLDLLIEKTPTLTRRDVFLKDAMCHLIKCSGYGTDKKLASKKANEIVDAFLIEQQ